MLNGTEVSSFNSLSRDHGPTDQSSISTTTTEDLSTPSLGITAASSTSRSRGRAFNSLSRDHLAYPWLPQQKNTLSTPSLGITRDSIERGCIIIPILSTPSLGITISPEDLALRRSTLSTPSLGITEPDSGIFRLSAAFCRGASSHK